MKFLEFKKLFNNYLLISRNEIDKLLPTFNKMNLINWQTKGYVFKIRNGLYCFSDIEFNENKIFLTANKIYSPSYVSMESALYYYGFIPEAVFKTTSVSTLKTKIFKTKFGEFSYHFIKPAGFWGYRMIQEENRSFKLAEPEKAIIDFLYFKSSIKSMVDMVSFRFNKIELKNTIEIDKLNNYANLIKSKALLKRVNILIDYMNA